ncbi:hypothetical protein PRIPAC_75607 [Pristionchus pacificus]|uniref:Abnormal cell migration protein 18-like fibronectin type I domain-containing protein n=1 Tax=Pristionchus pacificus TaxID=54126 RepID=A0A2A6CRG9_PRIPA|nr:hypothetical protein PRIPAC_75607 [Pristionchus pacificus]|eukprot:PDM80643.1 hypothetical protein PRIPAC_35646 [Pristionchus pacificus]
MILPLLLLSLLSSIRACDHRGQRRFNGETWVSNNNFFMRCTISSNSWSADIVGCVTDGGKHISIGETVQEGGLLVQCIRLPSGTVEFRRKRGNGQLCEGHQPGEKWLSNTNFRKQCTSEGRVIIVECVTDNGIPVGIGRQATVNGVKHSCNKQADGSVLLERELALSSKEIDNRIDVNPQVLQPPAPLPDLPNPQFKRFESEQIPLAPPDIDLSTFGVTVSPPVGARSCFHEGIWRKPEETWISEDKFTKKCTPQGAVVILNCVVNKKENVTIKIDSKIKIGRKWVAVNSLVREMILPH